MLHLSSRVVRSTLYTAIVAANSGLLASYAPVTHAATALEEVVVTARKREESVQEVPIAVSAFSAEQLRDAGVNSVKDMTQQVPGVSIDQGSIAQIWVRGVGQRDTSSRIDGPTGIYLDGVYLARKEGQLLDVFDAESIQLLRGPQGTLFGKNTTAGALVITSKKPTNEFGGEIDTRIGNYGRWDTKMSVNMPLIEDKLLSKLTLANVKRDGYQTNVIDGAKMSSEDRQAANLQLRWLPSDSVTVDGFFYAGKVRETSPGELGHLLYSSGYGGQDSMFANSIWPGDRTGVWGMEGLKLLGLGLENFVTNYKGYPEISPSYAANYLQQDGYGRHKVASNVPNRFNVDNYLAGVTVDWEINDDLSFKSITGYGYQIVGAMSLTADNDGSPAQHQLIGVPENSPRKQISQEFQLTGEAFDQKLNYTTGLFAMLEKVDDSNQSAAVPYGFMFPYALLPDHIQPLVAPGDDMYLLVPPNAYQDKFKQKNKTLAAFFQASYDVTEQFQVTGGLRWTLENRDVKLRHWGLDNNAFYGKVLGAGIYDFSEMGAMLLPPDKAMPFFPVSSLSRDPLSQIRALFPNDKNGFVDYPLTEMAPDHKSHTWTQLTPMVSLKYNLPDNWLSGTPINSSMVYFTYSDGFKAGAYDVLNGQLSQIDPETIKNFEVGLKLDAFDHTVRLNLAAYKMKYDDQQVIQVIPDATGNTAVAYMNAGKSEINGVEAEFVWQPITGLLINAGASYNDYDYKEFSGSELSTIHAFLGSGMGLAPPISDRRSEPFAEVPAVTYNLAVQYTFDTSWGSIIPRVQANYKSERYMGLDAGAGLVKDQSTIPGYTRIDARLAYRSPDQKTEVALYVDNLTDKLYYDGAASVGDSVGIFPLIDAPPRMWGIEASYKFGK